MKILIISPHKSFGGASASNHNIASMLRDNGHVVIYSDDISDKENSSFPFYGYRWKLGFSAYKYLRDSNFDYIFWGQAHYAIYYLCTLLLLRWTKGVKYGLIFHSLCLENTWKDKLYEVTMSISSFFADDLFFVSNYTKNSWNKYLLVRLNKNRQHVIFNAIPPNTNKIKADINEKPRISLVGRVSEEKNPFLFCEIARKYKNEYLFQAFGDGPLLQKLKKEYSSDVKWFGYCNDLNRIYYNTDILIVTSHFENCPMCILEAMSFGIPVISTKVGGIPEIVRSKFNGEFIDDENPIGGCDILIKRILSSYRQYHQNCISESQKYSFEQIARKWGKIFCI